MAIENEIKNVKYQKEYDEDMNVTGDNIGIRAEIDGQSVIVPLDPENTDYAKIKELVDDGTLTIADAD
jgi:hypothetical protein